MGSFYNTISLESTALQQANAKALSLENIIKEIWKEHPLSRFSPSEMMQLVDDKYGKKNRPLTSFRRAMTNLSGKEHNYFLAKTNQKRIGIYGREEHYWVLNSNDALQAFFEKAIIPKGETVESIAISNGNEPKINDNGSRQGNLWFFD